MTSSEGDARRCFLISPIGEDGSGQRAMADRVLRHLVRKAIEPLGIKVLRGDEDEHPGLITARTINLIKSAELIVVDLSGGNPNVFYEMAIAHGFRRPVVHIQERNETTPFDLREMRIVRYDMTDLDDIEQAQILLAQYAKHAIVNADLLDNPLSTAGQFLELQRSDNPLSSGMLRLSEVVEELRSDLRRAVASSAAGGSRSDVGDMAAEIGISRISTGGLGGTDLINRLGKSRLIRIISTSGVHLVGTYTSAFVQALANGCSVRLLLPEPDGHFVDDVEKLEEKELNGKRPTRIADEIESVTNALSIALKEAREMAARERNASPPGGVSVGYFSTHLRSTMVLCDETWGWLTLTLPPARSVDSPALQLSSSGSRPMLSACQRHFDHVWQTLVDSSKVRQIAGAS